jgi:hypothetical protein
MITKYIVFIFIILLIIYCIYISKRCTNTKIFEFDSNKPGPTILILAGTHGNEPAASHYFTQLIKNKIKINQGKLIIIPRVNDCALKINSRSIPLIGDINRKYNLNDKTNGEINDKTNGEINGINKQIMDIIKSNKIDFVLDFHEGYDFHKINKNSLGSTITYTNDKTGKAKDYGEKIVDKLNKTITDDKKKFTLLDYNYKPIKGTLLELLSDLNISGILIETSGQNNIQPLEKRLEQIDLIYKAVLL